MPGELALFIYPFREPEPQEDARHRDEALRGLGLGVVDVEREDAVAPHDITFQELQRLLRTKPGRRHDEWAPVDRIADDRLTLHAAPFPPAAGVER